MVPKKGNKSIPSSGNVKLSQLSSGKIILLSSQVTRAVLSMSKKIKKKKIEDFDSILSIFLFKTKFNSFFLVLVGFFKRNSLTKEYRLIYIFGIFCFFI